MIARRASALGLGVPMNIKRLTPSRLLNGTARLLGDSRYQRQAEKNAADEILRYVGGAVGAVSPVENTLP